MSAINLDASLPEMFPLTQELAELGFPVRLVQHPYHHHMSWYRVELDTREKHHLPYVDLTIDDASMASVAVVEMAMASQLDNLFRRVAHEWRLDTALALVRDLKKQIEEQKHLLAARQALISELTEQRDRAEAAMEAFTTLVNDPDRAIEVANQEFGE